MTKLDMKFSDYDTARARVAEIRKTLLGFDTEISAKSKALAQAQTLREEERNKLKAAKSRLREIAAELPQLIHSDVSGVCGNKDDDNGIQAAAETVP